jgi:hypothetical protein
MLPTWAEGPSPTALPPCRLPPTAGVASVAAARAPPRRGFTALAAKASKRTAKALGMTESQLMLFLSLAIVSVVILFAVLFLGGWL